MASIAEQLKSYREALASGEITAAEYEIFKADLLRQASSGPGGRRASTPAPAPAPEQVGAYLLLGELGRGGMGVVYRARHQLDSQAAKQGGDVALKLMHGAFAQDATYQARFEREADVGLRLEHPGIVRVHDLVVDAGRLALVMELVEGRPLTALLSERPPWARSLERFHGVLDAMRYSHGRRVLHRDLKPANVMVSRAGAWKVADFGLARAEDASAGLSLTASQGKLGTAAYMAPEQAEDAREADARSDVYALGLILWELLTGRAAWEAASSAEQLHRLKWQDRLVDLAELPARIPRALAEVAWKASRAAPGERQGSVAALQTELRLAHAKVAREEALLSSVGVGKAGQARPKPMPAPTPRPDLLDSVELPGSKPADEGARRERFELPPMRGVDATSERTTRFGQKRKPQPQLQDSSPPGPECGLESTLRPNPSSTAKPTPPIKSSIRRRSVRPRTPLRTLVLGIFGVTLAGGIALNVAVNRVSERASRDEALSKWATLEQRLHPLDAEDRQRAADFISQHVDLGEPVVYDALNWVSRAEALGSPITWINLYGGSYEMGGTDEHYSDEMPRHTVHIADFQISRTEVTVGQYRACVDIGPCSAEGLDAEDSCNWGKIGRDEHPINCLSWGQAAAFARWAGGRLPTEAEWEYSARSGGREVKYAWGNETPTCQVAVMNADDYGCGEGRTWAVCSKPAGNTDQGLCDMAGNVSEWVEDRYHRNYQGAPGDGSAWTSGTNLRVVRGSSWLSDKWDLRVTYRAGGVPHVSKGFRVAR